MWGFPFSLPNPSEHSAVLNHSKNPLNAVTHLAKLLHAFSAPSAASQTLYTAPEGSDVQNTLWITPDCCSELR